jgi:thymidylate synthase ThyX
MDEFTPEERNVLAPYFTNLDRPVFALTNLPEVVKGALFARYSRSAKSLRRLFLDEFADTVTEATGVAQDPESASRLFERVFVEYGDDSVAQLGGAHVAVEGISNVATKLLERGRLMSYLEQSTRYIRYDQPRNGSFLYMRPAEIDGMDVAARYHDTMDHLFRAYSETTDRVRTHLGGDDGDPAWRRAALAASLDAARGILPAATTSNVGVYGSGQAYEALLLRLYAHPLIEARELAQNLLRELEAVIPSFVKRVSRPERGGVWVEYLAERDAAAAELVNKLYGSTAARTVGCVGDDVAGIAVRLTSYGEHGEDRVLCAIAQEHSDLDHDAAWRQTRRLSPGERAQLMAAYVGRRTNRRHRPSRAFEEATYAFEILSDYGAFRDLQRHRMLTVEWQTPTTIHGYVRPALVDAAGCAPLFDEAMERAHTLHEALVRTRPDIAPYATCMAHRIRYTFTLNARELMHLCELRSTPQGHPAYRTVAQQMHQQVRDVAGHHLIADAMKFVDHTPSVGPGRLDAERDTEKRRSDKA